jgi:4-amino-4-deoxy-L-arabinose transferase-like glycosyltransferase
VIWWDESIYIGIGKYIASSGDLGILEIFRPPLFPLFFSLMYLFKIPLIFIGKFMVIVLSTASLYLIYLLSENIKRGSGIFSLIFLAIMPVFIFFTKIITTDIISTFFLLLSLLFYFKGKYFWVGLFIGVSFLFRFPQGLMLLCIGIVCILDTYSKSFVLWFKDFLKRFCLVFLGFILIVFPYLVFNYFNYNNFLEPMILASNVVKSSGVYYDFGIFYYAKEIFKTAPYLYLSLLIPIIYLKNDFLDKKSSIYLRVIIITAVIFTFYFFMQPHKELRYSLGFIFYLVILSGVIFSFIVSFFKSNISKRIFIIIFSLILLIYLSVILVKEYHYVTNDYKPLYSHIETLDGQYLSTTPMPVVLSDIKIQRIFWSKDSFLDSYENIRDNDGVILNSCDIYCANENGLNGCNDDVLLINDSIVKAGFRKTQEYVVNQCNFGFFRK